ICSASDADFEALLARRRDWQSLRRIASSRGSAGASQAFDWAGVVASPDGRIWGRNGPDILVLENERVVRRMAVPTETFDGARPQFFLDRRGRLWIPGHELNVVENGTIRVFDGATPRLEKVTAVFEDRRGTLWFGLAGEGLAALPDERSLEAWSEGEGISG